jgi:hypothetical protein
VNLKVIMREDVKCDEVNHICSIDLADKNDPQFTLYFFGDNCRNKEEVKFRLREMVDLYVSKL